MQRVVNCAARVLFGGISRDHIIPTTARWSPTGCKCEWQWMNTELCQSASRHSNCIYFQKSAQGIFVSYKWNFKGSIKNIHLLYFSYLKFVFFMLICSSSVFCILSLGLGQRLLYRLGSGLVLVLPYSVEVNILNVSPIIFYVYILNWVNI